MVDLSKIDKVFLFPGITDMRLGINGLRNNIPDIENDCLYVFCNKTKTSIKIIEFNVCMKDIPYSGFINFHNEFISLHKCLYYTK